MKYHQMTRILKQHGYRFDRQCRGAHELWRHQTTGETILVSRSRLVARAQQNWLQHLKKAAA